jgi:hypothetical protein
MPEKIPAEIQALVDSHTCGVPVIVVMSKSCRLLPRPLPAEYGLSYLGIFHIVQLDVGHLVFVSGVLTFSLCLV